VNVGTEPDVVSEIPADVIRVVVEHNIVTIPEPVRAQADLERRHAEIVAAEPEA
jgi:hypothetical protein